MPLISIRNVSYAYSREYDSEKVVLFIYISIILRHFYICTFAQHLIICCGYKALALDLECVTPS